MGIKKLPDSANQKFKMSYVYNTYKYYTTIYIVLHYL